MTGGRHPSCGRNLQSCEILVRTPRPFPTESLLGFVLRVAECNGYDSPRYVWELAQIPRGAELSPRFPIQSLAKILGQKAESWEHVAYRACADRSEPFKILGHSLGSFLWKRPLRLRKPAFCTQCVNEDGHIDAFWDLNAAVACPRHGCGVLAHCSTCNTALDWRRPGLLKCHCGSSLLETTPKAASTSTLELLALIYALLHGRSWRSISNTSGLPLEPLSNMPLRFLLQLLESLGEHVRVARGLPNDSKSSAVAEAATALEKWPLGYHNVLRLLGETLLQQNSSASSLRKQFNSFYEAMFKNGAFARYAGFLRQEFLTFGNRHWGKAVVDNRMNRGDDQPNKRRFISMSQLVSLYSISYSKTALMIAEGRIITKTIRAGKSTRTLVDLEHSQLPEQSRGVIGQRKAAAYVGLSVRLLEKLRDMGLFAPKFRTGRENCWHINDLDAICQHISSLRVVPADRAETVYLKKVMRLKLRGTSTQSAIIAALLDGRLSVRGCETNNFAGILLDKAQVETLVLEKRRESNGRSLTFSRCQTLTGIRVADIRVAAKLGFLTTIRRHKTTRVTEASVEAFDRKYIALARLAYQIKASPRALQLKCRREGIKTIALPRAGHSTPQYFVRRDAKEMLIRLKSPDPSPKKKTNSLGAYEEKLRRYLSQLLESSQLLPRKRGRPNLAAIGRACGFHRSIIKYHARLRDAIEGFDRRERCEPGRIGPDSLQLLRGYLEGLTRDGLPLPSHKGGANKRAIANACGIQRSVLYSHREAVKLLETYARRSSAGRAVPLEA
jgi:hypothetical protein